LSISIHKKGLVGLGPLAKENGNNTMDD